MHHTPSGRTRAAAAATKWRGGALAVLGLLSALGQTTRATAAERNASPWAGNLRVAWRVTSEADRARQGLGLASDAGRVVVDSRSGVSGRVVIQSSTRQVMQGQQAFQEVVVVNGGRARIQVSQQVPQTTWSFVGAGVGAPGGVLQPPGGSGSGGGFVAQTVWIDTGTGLSVRPQWAGGGAPVLLELEAQAAVPSEAAVGTPAPTGWRDPNLPPAQLSASTTLRVPLGQWVAVARTQQRMQVSQGSGRWSTTHQRDDGAVLEVQVSLP